MAEERRSERESDTTKEHKCACALLTDFVE
jgi:hypothetical protein